jgi:hypothetical protein
MSLLVGCSSLAILNFIFLPVIEIIILVSLLFILYEHLKLNVIDGFHFRSILVYLLFILVYLLFERK